MNTQTWIDVENNRRVGRYVAALYKTIRNGNGGYVTVVYKTLNNLRATVCRDGMAIRYWFDPRANRWRNTGDKPIPIAKSHKHEQWDGAFLPDTWAWHEQPGL